MFRSRAGCGEVLFRVRREKSLDESAAMGLKSVACFGGDNRTVNSTLTCTRASQPRSSLLNVNISGSCIDSFAHLSRPA